MDLVMTSVARPRIDGIERIRLIRYDIADRVADLLDPDADLMNLALLCAQVCHSGGCLLRATGRR